MDLETAAAYNNTVNARELSERRGIVTPTQGGQKMAVSLDHIRAQVELLRWCRDRKAEVADVEKQARAAVEEALGDNEAGTVDGDLAVTWRTSKRRALNQKALKESHPEIVESFYETSTVRRFEVV